MKIVRKRILTGILIATFLINMMMTSVPVDAVDTKVVAPINLSKTADVTQMIFNPDGNNDITLTYSVQPQPIPVQDVVANTTQREIVLVIDTSQSMAYDLDGAEAIGSNSRMEVAKAAAISFINQIKSEPSVKIGLIEYGNKADVFRKEGNALLTIDSTTLTELNSKINSLTPKGGSNIGDALRQAYFTLNAGSSTAEKYVIILNASTASAFTFNTVSGSNPGSPAVGTLYRSGMSDTIIKFYNSITYKTTSGDAANYFVNISSGSDYRSASSIYATNMAGLLKTSIKSYFIEIGDTTADTNFKKLSIAANGTTTTTTGRSTYKLSTTTEGINTIFSDIVTTIRADLKLGRISFEETFPSGISVVDIPSNMQLNGQLVTGSFSNIVYSLNTAGTSYVAQPISFSIRVRVAAIGNYIIGGNNSSMLTYVDISGSDVRWKYFKAVGIAVNAASPVLAENKILNILEIQPTRSFELEKGKIQTVMPGYTINLIQLSMPEFVGIVDEVNGLYDIIYIGKKVNYSGVTVQGASTSITANIDITDLKSKQIQEFITTGQLTVFDKDIFLPTGTNLEDNFKSYTSAHVHRVDNATYSTFYDDLSNWYQSANHKPTLTLRKHPLEYDGTESSYSANHTMSYLYDAFNAAVSPHAMSTELYLDVNGDGIFLANEKVNTESIQTNALGLAVNYSLDGDFNGCMPWKLVLIDTVTKAQDYETGFTVFDGVKNVVRVLQLIPGSTSLDIGSTAFKLPLDTDDYKIIITKMSITEFDANYPNPVSGKPTELNSNYDMIIFGFGDSYGNKDLNPTGKAIKAVDDFIKTGQSILFTHDTAGPQDFTNNFDMKTATQSYNNYVTYNDAPVITANFKDDMGFANTRTSAGMKVWKAWDSKTAFKFNEGLITQYPYILANNVDKTLSIATTHDQYWNIDLEDEQVVPWFTLYNGGYKYYPLAYYYTFSKGNITYSGTGHSAPSGTPEQELFVNTMIKASRGANHAPTMDVSGLYDGLNVPPSQDKIDFKLKIHDIDVIDQLFTAKFYTIVNGVETLVKTIPDLSKEVLTDISLDNSDDETITAFDIKIVVTDVKGAAAQQQYHLIHIEKPNLNVVATAQSAFLVGDVFSVDFAISEGRLQDIDKISNISLTANVGSTFLEVMDKTKWSGTVPTLTTTPTLTSGDKSRSLQLKATAVGTADINYTLGFSAQIGTTVNESKPGVVPIDIEEGIIKIQVLDNLTRAVNNAQVTVTASDGTSVRNGVTSDTGIVTLSDFKSDDYTVKVTVPTGYVLSADEQTITLVNSSDENTYHPTVRFIANDNVPPTIEYKHKSGFVVGPTGTTSMDVDVKFDGVKSKIAIDKIYVKKLSSTPNTVDAKLSDFAGVISSPYVLYGYTVSKTSPFVKDITKADGVEVFEYFTVTGNGDYGIYTINEAGNEAVKTVHIKNFIEYLPDLL